MASPAASASAAAASFSVSGADACVWGDGLTSTTGPDSFCTDLVFTDGGCTYWQCRPLQGRRHRGVFRRCADHLWRGLKPFMHATVHSMKPD